MTIKQIRDLIEQGYSDTEIEEIEAEQAESAACGDYRDADPGRSAPDYWRNDAGEYRLG
jgi:hypothetical protein